MSIPRLDCLTSRSMSREGNTAAMVSSPLLPTYAPAVAWRYTIPILVHLHLHLHDASPSYQQPATPLPVVILRRLIGPARSHRRGATHSHLGADSRAIQGPAGHYPSRFCCCVLCPRPLRGGGRLERLRRPRRRKSKPTLAHQSMLEQPIDLSSNNRSLPFSFSMR